MAQFTWLAPARWATPNNLFSDSEGDLAALTSGASKAFFGPCGPQSVFGRPGGAGGGSSFRITADALATQTQEILAILPVPDANQTSRVLCRAPASWTATPNGAVIAVPQLSTIALIRRSTTGSEVPLGTIDLAALDRNRWPLNLRLRVEGTGTVSVFARAWPIGEDEPAAWDIATTTTNANDTGFAMIGRTGTGFPAYLSHFAVGTEGDSAPGIFGALSGMVTASGSPVARPVVALARGDQKYLFYGLSDASGAFTIPALLNFD